MRFEWANSFGRPGHRTRPEVQLSAQPPISLGRDVPLRSAGTGPCSGEYVRRSGGFRSARKLVTRADNPCVGKMNSIPPRPPPGAAQQKTGVGTRKAYNTGAIKSVTVQPRKS